MKKIKTHLCWNCKEKEHEMSPMGCYCKECRLRMCKNEIKAPLFESMKLGISLEEYYKLRE